MSRTRGFCFTDHVCDEEFWHQFLEEQEPAYVIIGRENAPTTGRSHFQGYFYFKNARSLSSIRRLLDGRHVEAARGSPEQNKDYCAKDGNIVMELGELPRKGKRSDIETVKDGIKRHGKVRKVVEEVNSYQALKFAETYVKYVEPGRAKQPNVYWYYGPTGTGKTWTAYRESNDSDRWVSGGTLKWFQGYDGHKDVVFDDFRHDHCSFSFLLRLLDRYPITVEQKGASRQFLAENIWITSPVHPKDCYPPGEDVDQLLRRIKVIREFQELPEELEHELWVQQLTCTEPLDLSTDNEQ